ncbi:MAG: N-acetylmuramoyl-L-alanine amidase [Verrucomicrobiota bacterium]|nr:N-acetylmuramoyl-L-alanine amidase [Verrucomicrobiota bacterium]
MKRRHLSKHAARVVTWLGLALITASLLVMILTSPPASVPSAVNKTSGEFNLVVLDPGHGGDDSGAMTGGMVEKDLTLDVAQRVDRKLHENGLSTMLTRSSDAYVSLAERAAISNRAESAIFVSIHFNDGARPEASGVETYFAERQAAPGLKLATWFPFLRTTPSAPRRQSQSLAAFIQQEVVKETQAPDRGTKAEQFFVLANTKHAAALVEGGFLTNKDDAQKLGSADYREHLAGAIAKGIVDYRETLKHEALPLADAAPALE